MPKKEVNMHIRDYKYTAENVDCQYCTEFRHGHCGAIKCPWLHERIEAGVVSYHDAVNESFSSRSPLLRRIRLVLTFYDKSFWKDDEHFRRFQQADAILGFYKSRNTNEYYSALFLLTADHSLFLRFLDCFNRREINFDLAYLKGITPEHYALYKIAKSLYTGTAEVGVLSLAPYLNYYTTNRSQKLLAKGTKIITFIWANYTSDPSINPDVSWNSQNRTHSFRNRIKPPRLSVSGVLSFLQASLLRQALQIVDKLLRHTAGEAAVAALPCVGHAQQFLPVHLDAFALCQRQNDLVVFLLSGCIVADLHAETGGQ